MTRAMYVRGNFTVEQMLAIAANAFSIPSIHKAVIIHRDSKGKRIGHFVVHKEPSALEYFPETKEGEEFSWQLSKHLREQSTIAVVDILDL
jgi:hypothetical protein